MESVYQNYANALYSLLESDESALLEYQKALKEIANTLREEPDFLRLLDSYSIDESKKLESLEKVFGGYGLRYLVPFLRTIVVHHRIKRLGEIEREYSSLVNGRMGISEGIAYSVNKLSEKEMDLVSEAISKKIGHKAVLRNVIDSSLLGGVKVSIEDRVYDGSLKNKLTNLGEHLSAKGGKA